MYLFIHFHLLGISHRFLHNPYQYYRLLLYITELPELHLHNPVPLHVLHNVEHGNTAFLQEHFFVEQFILHRQDIKSNIRDGAAAKIVRI